MSSSSPFLHPQHLVSVLLPQLGVNALVDAHWVHGESDGQQAVHLLVLFVNLLKRRNKYESFGCVATNCQPLKMIPYDRVKTFQSDYRQCLRSPAETDHLVFVGGALEHVSGPLDVQQDVCKDSDGILVAPHHQVGETHVVVGGDLALGHTRVHTLRGAERHA